MSHIPIDFFSNDMNDTVVWSYNGVPPPTDDQHNPLAAIILDGVNQGARASGVLLENDTAQTFALWTKIATTTAQHMLILQGSGDDTALIRMSILADGTIRLRAEGGNVASATISDSSTTFDNNEWRLIIGVRDGVGTSTTCKIYDGNTEVSYVIGRENLHFESMGFEGSAAISAATAAADLQIGRRFADGCCNLAGIVSRPRVWRSALNQAQIDHFVAEELAAIGNGFMPMGGTLHLSNSLYKN